MCDVDPIAQENYAEGRADEREAIVAWLRQQLDFGLGTFKGEPVVGVTMGGSRFHRHDHRGRYALVTWTYGYVTDEGSCGVWQPCQACFPGHPPIPTGEQFVTCELNDGLVETHSMRQARTMAEEYERLRSDQIDGSLSPNKGTDG